MFLRAPCPNVCTMVSKANMQAVEEGTGIAVVEDGAEGARVLTVASVSYSADLILFKQKVGRQRECLGRMYFLFLRK